MAEAEQALKDARAALIGQLGPTAAAVLGITPKMRAGRKRRAVAPPPLHTPPFGSAA